MNCDSNSYFSNDYCYMNACCVKKIGPFKYTEYDIYDQSYYRVQKNYDECCKPYFHYEKVCYYPIKKPGNDFYQTNFVNFCYC